MPNPQYISCLWNSGMSTCDTFGLPSESLWICKEFMVHVFLHNVAMQLCEKNAKREAVTALCLLLWCTSVLTCQNFSSWCFHPHHKDTAASYLSSHLFCYMSWIYVCPFEIKLCLWFWHFCGLLLLKADWVCACRVVTSSHMANLAMISTIDWKNGLFSSDDLLDQKSL